MKRLSFLPTTRCRRVFFLFRDSKYYSRTVFSGIRVVCFFFQFLGRDLCATSKISYAYGNYRGCEHGQNRTDTFIRSRFQRSWKILCCTCSATFSRAYSNFKRFHLVKNDFTWKSNVNRLRTKSNEIICIQIKNIYVKITRNVLIVLKNAVLQH